MSIEWLLVKTQNAEFQKRASQGTRRKPESSDKPCDWPPKERTEESCGHKGRRQPANERLAAEGVNGFNEVYLRCECGREGTLSPCGADFRILAEEKDGAVRFECPNCGRYLRYDPLTGTIRTRKGILGFLLGRFS